MSELKVDKVSPRTGTYVSLNTVGSKNIIINGDMSIAQRGTSTASITSDGYYTVDRFKTLLNTLGTWTQSQSTDVPSGQGFATSLKMDCTTADGSPAAGDYLVVQQVIEGQNLQYLKKGTANAESVTLSFWVKSNKTGTYTFELFDFDNTRQISKTYTIDSASTWEKKTITIDGDTSGAFDNDNGASLWVSFWLGAGSDFNSGTLSTTWTSSTNANRVSSSQVNLADNTANEWFVTAVQLEAGTTPSDFEFLPYDVNLRRCLRYYEVIAEGNTKDISFGATYVINVLGFPIDYFYKRTTPSLDIVSGTNYYLFYTGANNYMDDITISSPSFTRSLFYNNTDLTVADNTSGFIRTANASSYVALDAEL